MRGRATDKDRPVGRPRRVPRARDRVIHETPGAPPAGRARLCKARADPRGTCAPAREPSRFVAKRASPYSEDEDGLLLRYVQITASTTQLFAHSIAQLLGAQDLRDDRALDGDLPVAAIPS